MKCNIYLPDEISKALMNTYIVRNTDRHMQCTYTYTYTYDSAKYSSVSVCVVKAQESRVKRRCENVCCVKTQRGSFHWAVNG